MEGGKEVIYKIVLQKNVHGTGTPHQRRTELALESGNRQG
jgi:hypothetical protein